MLPRLWTGVVATACSTMIMAPAGAETTLRIDTWISPKHPQNALVLPHWAESVEKATQGRVKVTISYPPNVHPKTMFDRARTGIADVTWSFHGYNPGRFLMTQIVELPGLNASAYEATVAYNRIHPKYLAKAKEHEGVKLLTLFCHGPGAIHTKQRITSIEQFKGLKIRTPGGIGGIVSESLGVVSVPAPATKVYELLQQGVADGVVMPMETKLTLNLREVAPYTLIYPGGLYMGSFFMVMNQDRYRKLPKEDREAIDRVSGEDFAKFIGRAWAEADEKGLAAAKAAGNTIETAPPKLAAAMKAKIAHVQDEWIEKATAKGVEAKAALAALHAEVQKIKKNM